MFTAGVDVAVLLELPARSLTDLASVWSVPSDVIVELMQASAAKPEPPVSAQLQATVTSELNHPAALGLPTGAPLIVGVFLSILIGPTVVDVVLLAKSKTVPVTEAPVTFAENVLPVLHDRTPERLSAHVNLTTTFVLFQPSPFGAGLRVATIVGATRSILITALPVRALPTRSVATDCFRRPVVSTVTTSVAGVGPVATPEPVSVADHVRLTSELHHPLTFDAGEMPAVTVGAVLSTVYETSMLAAGPVHAASSRAVTVVVRAPSGPDATVTAKSQVLPVALDVVGTLLEPA
jgi:hypothetical protein